MTKCPFVICHPLQVENYTSGTLNARECATLEWTYLALVSAFEENCVCPELLVPHQDNVVKAW